MKSNPLQQLVHRLATNEAAATALSLVMVFWQFGTVAMLALYGAIGAGHWWMTLLAVAMGASFVVVIAAANLRATDVERDGVVEFRVTRDAVVIDAKVLKPQAPMADVAASDIGVDLDLEAGRDPSELMFTRAFNAHGIMPDWILWQRLVVADREGRETRSHRLVWLVSAVVSHAVMLREGDTNEHELSKALHSVMVECVRWLEDLRRRREANARTP